MSPFSAWSLRKWCLISICLVLECCMGFFEIFMALILSHLIGTCSKDNSKSLSVYFIQRICAQHKLVAMYSASAVDKATKFCFLLCHETSECPRKWQVPLVLFLSTLQPAKLASKNLINSKLWLSEYHKLMSIVPFKYLRIRFMALKWDSLGHDRNLAHKHTLYMMSSLLVVKYSQRGKYRVSKGIDTIFHGEISVRRYFGIYRRFWR